MLFTSYCLIYLLSSTNAYTIKSERRSNFEATFGATPSPFQINVNPQFIAETKLKATLTRYTVDANVSAWYDGPPRENVTTVRDYWVNQYDWFSVQEGLNKQYVLIEPLCPYINIGARFTQFTTTVFANESSTYEDPIPLHFVHHVSPRADAIPLLFLHGWPGSFMEVGPIIQGLTHPPSSAMPAFHVVAPSIPGFGFSPAPTSPGLNFQVAAVAYNELMIQLGYRKYVVQGGDLGAITSHFLAGTFPENVVSVHSNFWLVQPNATDIERFNNGLTTHDENTTIENLSNFSHELSGFTHIQEAMPLEAATALTDSPVGYAMWIFPLLHFGVDVYEWSAEEVITWSMMHYIQGPFGAMRMYKEAAEV